MTVEVWMAKEFSTTHEMRALRRLIAQLEQHFGSTSDLYAILVNFFIPGSTGEVDVAIVKKNAVLLLDLKECSDPVSGKENGPWKISDGKDLNEGRLNPFEQLRRYRYDMSTFLDSNKSRIFDPQKSQFFSFRKLNCCVVFSPSMHPACQISIDKKNVWFHISGLDTLWQTVKDVRSTEISLSDAEIRKLAQDVLGLPQVDLAIYLSQPDLQATKTMPAVIDYYDYADYIEEKSKDFVGRQWLDQKIQAFTAQKPRGYFFILGDPGIGKTAFMANLVKQHGYAHHFNIRAEALNTAGFFLRNISLQLAQMYALETKKIPAGNAIDARFFNNLLKEVSLALKPGKKAVILVDALDETSGSGFPEEANLLLLPITLPKNIYFVITSRRISLQMRIECEQERLQIDQDTPENIEDILAYLELYVTRAGIQHYLAEQNIRQAEFVEMMQRKCQGNFMYLRYVLPEIESGAYANQALTQLPIGLANYYEDHWRRIRGRDEAGWISYKLPVIIALTVTNEPISLDLIADFSKIANHGQILSVIHEWKQFLFETQILHQGVPQKRWRLYHDSFRDFIAAKDEVEGEHIHLRKTYNTINNDLWRTVFGDTE